MVYTILDNITSPEDLKDLPKQDLKALADEIRHFLIHLVASKEGHLGASLGVVELTIALHKVLDTPNDKLVWDVGHQAYVHKILTGRKNQFQQNREFGGISGFPKRDESPFDDFGTGHSSTSISAVLGMALAADLKGNSSRLHVAVIGDASIASGMAFEALNHLGVTKSNVLIILNDNEMGIDPNVGAFKEYLYRLKQGEEKGLTNIFDHFNIDYTGPINGHDLEGLIDALDRLKDRQGPRILHVVTKKGKGLKAAEEDQITFHAPGKFNPLTGELKPKTQKAIKYQYIFGRTMVDLAREFKDFVCITPAMPTGSGLRAFFENYPDRAFDVGISEQHALTLAAGFSTQGILPVVAIYSTFLQRAYDQLIHDIALQNLPALICIDRAGLVGEDGPTHHGAFDLSYLLPIPNLEIYAPKDGQSLRNYLIEFISKPKPGPICIRYPRGVDSKFLEFESIHSQRSSKHEPSNKHKRIALIGIGSAWEEVEKVPTYVDANTKSEISVFPLEKIKPLPVEYLKSIIKSHQEIIFYEDNAEIGGAGSFIKNELSDLIKGKKVTFHGIPDQFITQGKVDELKKSIHLRAQDIASNLF